jgi:hypothetical protein
MSAVCAIDDWDLAGEPKSGVRERNACSLNECAYRMDAEAEALLLEHLGLVALLDEACEKLRELFGPGATFELERFDDPESSRSKPTLFLTIRTDSAFSEADATLRRFDDEWWFDNLHRARGKLEFCVEPQL